MSEAAPPLVATVDAGAVAHDSHRCANCSAEGRGSFCSECGQKRFHPGDLRVGHAWHHILHELSHVDGKIFHSLKVLFTRPGQITLDFLEGRRARHVHPIRLFLIFSFFYVLTAPGTHPIFSLWTQQLRHLLPSRQLAKLELHAAQRGLGKDAAFEQVHARLVSSFNYITVGAAILNGFGLWVLFLKKRPFLAENLVMALHLACFDMVLLFIIHSLLAHWRGWMIGVEYALLIAYFVFAGRRVYADSWILLTLKWILLRVLAVLFFAACVIIITGNVLMAF
jgi:Protein of unknown function (DUF3667)